MSTTQGHKFNKFWARNQRLGLGIISVAAFLFLWALAAKFAWLNPIFISNPLAVIKAGGKIVTEAGFAHNAWVSFQELAVGLAAGIIVGIGFGVILGRYRTLGQIADPIVMAFNAVPRTALLPILVLWVGIGMSSKIVVVFLGAVFPVIVNTMVGVRGTDTLLLNVARSFGAKESDVLLRVMIPSALPAMLTGLRLGYGRALIGVIVGEMFVSTEGIGNLLMLYGGAFRMAELLFLVLIIAAVGVAGVTLISKLEERVSLWR